MDALANVVAAAPLLRRQGSVRMLNPRAPSPMTIPTPILPCDLVTVFLALAEGWLIDLPEDETVPEPTEATPPTTAILRRSTTRRRRRR